MALKEVQALKQGRGVSIPGQVNSLCWKCWVRREQGCYRNRERAGGSRGLERERWNQGQGLMDAFRAPEGLWIWEGVGRILGDPEASRPGWQRTDMGGMSDPHTVTWKALGNGQTIFKGLHLWLPAGESTILSFKSSNKGKTSFLSRKWQRRAVAF